ncbi:lipocalin family protein [Sphingobacterium lactis]|uniref:lipocalin family protein n=1 Tax=Sphingobacterium lactis TaxID=797291 RepID=UPI003EC932EC
MHKRIISFLSLLTALLVLGSCGAPRKGATGGSDSGSVSAQGPSASQWRSGVKGKWILNSVTRENIPSSYTVKNMFEEAPVDCFIGSLWDLPGGANRGSITFNADGQLCAAGTVRNIVWSIHDPKNGGQPSFQFKKIYAGDKASNVNSGFRLDLSYADENSLEMRLPVALNEGTGNLVLKFSRAAE